MAYKTWRTRRCGTKRRDVWGGAALGFAMVLLGCVNDRDVHFHPSEGAGQGGTRSLASVADEAGSAGAAILSVYERGGTGALASNDTDGSHMGGSAVTETDGSSVGAGGATMGASSGRGSAQTSSNAGSSSVANGLSSAGTTNGRAGGMQSGAGANTTSSAPHNGGAIAGSGAGTDGRSSVGGDVAGSAGAARAEPQSCQDLSTWCQSESCCKTITMPGGTFNMGRGDARSENDYYNGGQKDETPEHNAAVGIFALDKYEVTVGRFRKFVAAYDTWHARDGNPLGSSGAHPTAADTGWGSSWIASPSDLPADSKALITMLKCDSDRTWADDEAAGNESYPINCVTWYVAFAFCIWDGGRLPTEAEWEYAAAGGMENLLYPWGKATPDASRANYGASDFSSYVAVGSKGITGAGYFGHQDLAGSMWEWMFDWYSAYYYGTLSSPVDCSECANSTPTSYRATRGGCWTNYGDVLRAAVRDSVAPEAHSSCIGLRCARKP